MVAIVVELSIHPSTAAGRMIDVTEENIQPSQDYALPTFNLTCNQFWAIIFIFACIWSTKMREIEGSEVRKQEESKCDRIWKLSILTGKWSATTLESWQKASHAMSPCTMEKKIVNSPTKVNQILPIDASRCRQSSRNFSEIRRLYRYQYLRTVR